MRDVDGTPIDTLSGQLPALRRRCPGYGAGIFNYGTLTVRDTALLRQLARVGGWHQQPRGPDRNNSTLSSNYAIEFGGGIGTKGA